MNGHVVGAVHAGVHGEFEAEVGCGAWVEGVRSLQGEGAWAAALVDLGVGFADSDRVGSCVGELPGGTDGDIEPRTG